MTECPYADTVVLRSLRPKAPPFHRFIVKKKLEGNICRAGDQVVIYEVVQTIPSGQVLVTADTEFRFE